MKWLAAAGLFVLAGYAHAVDTADPKDCRVPGTPAQWVAAYCMEKTESDNPDSPPVQACLTSEIRNKVIKEHNMSECEQKIYRKKQICAIFSPDPAQQAKCSQDPNFVPMIVKQTAQ